MNNCYPWRRPIVAIHSVITYNLINTNINMKYYTNKQTMTGWEEGELPFANYFKLNDKSRVNELCTQNTFNNICIATVTILIWIKIFRSLPSIPKFQFMGSNKRTLASLTMQRMPFRNWEWKLSLPYFAQCSCSVSKKHPTGLRYTLDFLNLVILDFKSWKY